MADILGLAQYVQQQGATGKEAGQKSRLAKLYSQALAAPDDQRNSYLPQMAAEDPATAMQAQGQFNGMRKDAYDDLGREANMFVAQAQSGDPATTQAAYQRLAQKAQAAGHPVPPNYDPKMLPMIEKLAGTIGGGDEMKSLRVGANGNFMAIRNGQLVDTGIAADTRMQLRDQPGIDPSLVNLRTGAQIPLGGVQQQAAPTPAPGEVPFTIDPSLPPEVQAQIRANPQAGSAQGVTALPQAGAPQATNLAAQRPLVSPAEQQRLQIEQEHLRLAENADKRAASAASDTTAKPTPEEVDFYAQMSNAGDYSWATGMARGKSGQALIAAVRSRQVQLANGSGMAPQDVTANRASGAALTKTLADRQKYVTAVEQLNGTLNRQANLVESLMAKGAANGNSPIINKWIQAGRKATGDPDVAAFDAAIRGLGREHQRVLTGPLSNAQLAVSAAETADSLLNRDMTPAQIRATIQVMRTEARNGKEQGEQTLEDTRSQLRNMNRQQPAKPAGGILKFNPATGKIE